MYVWPSACTGLACCATFLNSIKHTGRPGVGGAEFWVCCKAAFVYKPPVRYKPSLLCITNHFKYTITSCAFRVRTNWKILLVHCSLPLLLVIATRGPAHQPRITSYLCEIPSSSSNAQIRKHATGFLEFRKAADFLEFRKAASLIVTGSNSFHIHRR